MKSPAVSVRALLVAYLISITFVSTASLFPGQRMWGLNWLAYQNTWVILSAALLLAATLFFVWMRSPSLSNDPERNRPGKTYWWVAGIASVIILALMVLFPSRSFFGGDGYQLLARLGRDEFLLKIWNRGISEIVASIYGFLLQHGYDQPVDTYRILSIGSGVLFLITLLASIPRMEKQTWKRILLFAGLIGGGYMINFWGYVEYYAPLILLSTLFVLLGILHTQGKIAIWWSIAALAAACVVHLLALAFLPSFIYLLMKNSTFVNRLSKISAKTMVLWLVAIAVVGAAVYWTALSVSVALRYTLLPVLPNTFPHRVGAILTLSHIADFLNLMLLLCPGLIVLAVTYFGEARKSKHRSSVHEFLVIAAISPLLAVLVIDPRLGMPRDWDLLSFAGFPLVLLVYKAVLDRCSPRRAAAGAILSIALGTVVLGLRVVVQSQPSIAADHYKDYLELDPQKTINGRMVLIDYYDDVGDTLRANQERLERSKKFPELALNDQVVKFVDQGQFRQSLQLSRRILQLNPQYVDAYFNTGGSLYSLGMADSALYYLKIADAMNPFNAQFRAMLGGVYLRLGEARKGEDYLVRAFRMDSTQTDAAATLISMYITQGRLGEAAALAERLRQLPDAPPQLLLRVAARFAQNGTYEEAVKALQHSLELGINPAVIDSFVAHFPPVSPYLKSAGILKPDSLNC